MLLTWFRKNGQCLYNAYFASRNYVYPEEQHLNINAIHNVVIIQPIIRHVELLKKLDLNIKKSSNAFQWSSISELAKGPNENEAKALVDSIGGWTISKVLHVNLRSKGPVTGHFFTTGIWNDLTNNVSECLKATSESPPATAVFVNWKRLSVSQILEMQKRWHCPVFDRYTLVIHLFLLRSRTREAKAQAQLAELNLLRQRNSTLTFLNPNRMQPRDSNHLQYLYNNQERRLLSILEDCRSHRELDRVKRREKIQNQLPTVAVIGYTNAGKTSLIKYLSGSKNLHGSPSVFATLSITHHAARLSSFDASMRDNLTHHSVGVPGLRLLMTDTIGFMADLPSDLINAFKATFVECLDADIILHVIDISEPGWQSLARYIERVVMEAGIRPRYLSNIDANIESSSDETTTGSNNFVPEPLLIRVGNKCDLGLMNQDANSDDKFDLDLQISSKTGAGVPCLSQTIQMSLLRTLGWMKKKIKMRQESEALRWLYANAMITDLDVCRDDNEKLLCEVFFNKTTWECFKSRFQLQSNKY